MHLRLIESPAWRTPISFGALAMVHRILPVLLTLALCACDRSATPLAARSCVRFNDLNDVSIPANGTLTLRLDPNITTEVAVRCQISTDTPLTTLPYISARAPGEITWTFPQALAPHSRLGFLCEWRPCPPETHASHDENV